MLDGRTLRDVRAHGKHLFYEWEPDVVLHVHLGLFGTFRAFRSDPRPPTSGTRLAMANADVTIYLAGPTVCEVLDPAEADAIHDRLGPDPLARRSARSRAEFARRLARRTIPVGAALLDQKVIAGIGNVYRAELLFLCGIAPDRAPRSLSPHEVTSIWDTAATQLRMGEKTDRIITVDPVDVGVRRRGQLHPDEHVYVYQRGGEPCRRCSTPIEHVEMAGRTIWFCPSCQA